MREQRLGISVMAAALCVVGRAGAQGAYAVGPNVQVTHADIGQSVFETYVCADPRDARRLVAGAIVEREATGSNAFFVSFDGGASWRETLVMPRSVDPACAFDARG